MKQPEIKQALLSTLKGGVDAHLEALGYHRSPRGLTYTRSVNGAKLQFTIDFVTTPNYAQGRLAHLTPSLCIENKSISDVALRLVEDPKLLANAPAVIQNRGLTMLTDPQMPEWYVDSVADLDSAVLDIRHIFEKHGVSFLENYSTPLGIIEQDESDDKRAFRQLHFYVYVIAAYLLEGRREDALSVLHDRFAKPGILKRYRTLWTNLNAEQSRAGDSAALHASACLSVDRARKCIPLTTKTKS